MPALDLLPPRNPSGTAVLGFLLARTQWSLGIGHRRRLSRRDRNPATTGPQHLLQSLAGILQQVKPVSDLKRSRHSLPCSFGIRLRSVSHADLNAGMSTKPGGQCLGGPPREQIDRTMGLKINQDCGVHPAATDGEIIDAKDSWGSRQREDGATK